ncbi:hypothetical protein KKH23_05670, partial [Patescibacteria group bacterium]|nr:hypothetical protein [Patescibacteria group bacterium]
MAKYKTIVNLGAHRGKKTVNLAGKCDLLVSVEPVAENYRVLLETIVERRLKNVIPVFAAIGRESGMGRIHLAKTSQSHSMYFMRKFDKLTPTRRIMVVSWDDLMQSLDIGSVGYA